MRSPYLAGAFLVITLTVLALIGYAIHQKDLRVSAEAASVAKDLELAGAKAALLVSPREVVRFVEVPAAVKAAVKSGALIPIAAGKLTATSSVVAIPCPPPTEQPTLPEGIPPVDAPAPTANVQFGLTGEFFLGKIDHGKVEFTSSFKATVFDDHGWNADVPFAPENVKFDIAMSDDVSKAIQEYSRPWFKKHFRPYVGVGLSVNPFNGRVDVGVQAGYGLVF